MNSNRRAGATAAVLLGAGLLLMIVPPVARDGICGFSACADQVPPIAVARVSKDRLAIVVPDAAASTVRSVELLQGGGTQPAARRWLIARDGDGTVSTFVVGSTPSGFREVVGLDEPPVKDVWTAQVGFRCTTASLPFSPATIAVGEVRSWDGVVDGRTFAAATTTERCATERGTAETAMFLVGALLAVTGAVLGIVVVLRRPARFPEEPDDDEPRGDGSVDSGDDATLEEPQ